MSPQIPPPATFDEAYAGPIDFQTLGEDVSTLSPGNGSGHLSLLRDVLAQEFYGAVPPAPDKINLSRQPIVGERAERLLIEIEVAGRQFAVDAALWLPAHATGPVPLICGLDFVGPIGIMTSTGFPIDPAARISPRPKYGASDKRLRETLRGTAAYHWPVSMLLDAGYAVLTSCYGSWVPDDADGWKLHGLYPLLGFQDETPIGAISLWAWAIQRLLDAAETCDEIDSSNILVAGHSRLGKAALWAAANDPRIGAVLANNSGCGGTAPAAHKVGETLEQMARDYPHWTIPARQGSATKLSFDQHHLVSLVAPRSVYVACAREDLWSDPMGSYLALREASRCWEASVAGDWNWPPMQEVWQQFGKVHNGPLGYHLRPGEHDLLPYDWRHFLEFIEAQ